MLDISWKNSLVDGSLGKVYLLGASDFQRRVLEALELYAEQQLKAGNAIPSLALDDNLNLIKNLKYETNKG